MLLVVAAASDLAAQSQSQSPAPREKRERTPSPEAAPGGKGDRSEKGEKGDKGEKKEAQKRPFRVPGASIPDDPAKRARLLSDLYAMLATAESQEAAGQITNAIERVWGTAAGDTVTVLMERATKAAAEQRPDLALRMLDTVTRIAPDLPEGFNRRAYVYYSLNEYERAMGDLRRVLALDPSHYKALDGLGQMLREIGKKKAALDVYRRLVEVHPFQQGAKSTLDELEREIAGQES